MSSQDQENLKENPTASTPSAPLNKLDALKLTIREVINIYATKKQPESLKKFIQTHVMEEMSTSQTAAIRSGMFFLSSMMHMPRYEFYTQLIDTMRDEMLSKIQELSSDINNPATVNKLRECLRTTFKMIHYAELQPVVMKLLDTVGGKLRSDEMAQAMEILSMDKTLYLACPLGVKRRIWKQHPDMFQNEIFPMFNGYRMECEVALHSTERSMLSQLPKDRRKRDLVVRLVDMVGESSFLYSRLIGCLRDVYYRTRCSHFCTLRAEILLSLNDRKLTSLCNQDDTHHFAWVLDACVRDRWIDAKRAKELESCYSQVPDKNSRDIRMLCSDPHVIHTVCISIVREIEESVDSNQLPKLSASLRFLYILLCIGVKVLSQEVRMVEFQTSLLPRIASLIANATYADELLDLGRLRRQRDAQTAADTPAGRHKLSDAGKDKSESEKTAEGAADGEVLGQMSAAEEQELANMAPELLPAKRAKLCRDSYVASRVSQMLLQHHCLHAVENRQTALATALFEIMNSLEMNQIRPDVLQGIVVNTPEDAPWRRNSLFSYMRDRLLNRTTVAAPVLERWQFTEGGASTSAATAGPSTPRKA